MKPVFFLITLFITTTLTAQMTQERVISNYIYNFAKETTWPDKISNNSFEIYLLSSNKHLFKTFKALTKDQTLHSKPIKIRQSTSVNIPYSTNVVYVDTPYLDKYRKIYKELESRPVLIISNKYDNKRLVMINISKTTKQNLRFEINKANILNQRLSINPKIILLGGTELDVAALYKSAKNSLLEREDELAVQLERAVRLNNEILLSKKTNKELQKDIIKHKDELLATEAKLNYLKEDKKRLKISVDSLHVERKKASEEFTIQMQKQSQMLKKEKASTQKIRDDFKMANAQLDSMSVKLDSQQIKLTTKEKEVQAKENKLISLSEKIAQKAIEFESLQDDIQTQGSKIKSQTKTIDSQQQTILYVSIVASIFLFLVFVIFRTLRREHRTNDELHETKEALEVAIQKTELANESKTKFLAHMSHELRTPLNAVLGYSQLLQKDTSLSNKNQKILTTINSSGEHLLSLINDVLEVSKIETGKIELEPISFDLYILLDGIYSMFEQRVESHGVHLELLKDSNLPQFIHADINKIRQIFINMLGNSIKFTTHGSIKIRVGHNLKNRELLIEIEDTGEGISEKEIKKLFQPFAQTISGKLGGGGAGLGLSIVLEYIELMGGKIDVKSKVAFGTIFYITLPYEVADEAQYAQSRHREVLSLGDKDKGMKVIIADDNKVNNDLLEQTLREVGFDVIAVENGFEAYRVFKNIKAPIVFLDLEMPVMDGFESLRQIRELEYAKETTIIAITASVFSINNKKAQDKGFSALVKKPFKDYEVFEAIALSENIEFLYVESEKEEVNVDDISLDNIDDTLRLALIEAVSKNRIGATTKLLAEAKENYPDEAKLMQYLVDEFEYPKLADLLRESGT